MNEKIIVSPERLGKLIEKIKSGIHNTEEIFSEIGRAVCKIEECWNGESCELLIQSENDLELRFERMKEGFESLITDLEQINLNYMEAEKENTGTAAKLPSTVIE
ncbi:MAG: hypothetical protein ACI4I9_07980 [Porcipelethomonas sp.]